MIPKSEYAKICQQYSSGIIFAETIFIETLETLGIAHSDYVLFLCSELYEFSNFDICSAYSIQSNLRHKVLSILCLTEFITMPWHKHSNILKDTRFNMLKHDANRM